MIKKYPFYLKSTVIIFGLVLFFFVLFILKSVLIPLSFGVMLAILLNPFVNFLQKHKWPKLASITVAILTSLVVLASLIYFLSVQLSSFSDQLPAFQKKFVDLLHQLQRGISERFNIDVKKQNEWINNAESGLKTLVGQTLGMAATVLEVLFLIPFYALLFLYFKPLLLNFLYEVFDEAKSKEVGVVLAQTKEAVQQYMFGLLIEAVIVATLNSIALLVLGLKYAILLGLLGALLNVLPFIGGIIAVLLPLVIATVTKDGFGIQIGIIISYLVIQFIDNHFLVPYIVSSKVKINALISIVMVLLGGLLWGIAGMFLSIPFIGILKIIFDRVPELKPWGKLFGDEVPTRHKGEIWNVKRLRRYRTT
jgi:predicted PurR-regulated permease PerM